MSVVSTTNTIDTPQSTEYPQLHASRPGFFGILRGEFFKMSRQWATWIMAVMFLGSLFMPYVLTLVAPNIADQIHKSPLGFFERELGYGTGIVRIFGGIFLLIVMAQAIGLEYRLGTIRILLARGVGRLQLLFAKLLAVVIVAILLLIAAIVLNILLLSGLVLALTGNLNAFNALNSQFWSDAWLALLTIMASMGVTILMAMAMAVVGRSQVFGLSAALAWFPVDNFAVLFILLAARLTKAQFWSDISGYLLGPNLNVMPASVISPTFPGIGIPPLVQVDGTHTLVVTLVYAIIFAAIGIVLTWRRDVKE
ncbi:MAG: ABC transporter permease [Ktedonobacteraceae bacterium]|nr:ABC transporter permease [Ktedonobacteraceae bacterium]